MRKNLVFILFCIFFVILVSCLVSGAKTLTTFSNSLSEENLTFTGKGSYLRYFNLPKTASISSATLDLKGYNTSGAYYYLWENFSDEVDFSDYWSEGGDSGSFTITKSPYYESDLDRYGDQGTYRMNLTTDNFDLKDYDAFEVQNLTYYINKPDAEANPARFRIYLRDESGNEILIFSVSVDGAGAADNTGNFSVNLTSDNGNVSSYLDGVEKYFESTSSLVSGDKWGFNFDLYSDNDDQFGDHTVNTTFSIDDLYIYDDDSYPNYVKFDTGNDGDYEYEYSGTSADPFNETQNDLNINTTELEDWLSANCASGYCNVSINFTSDWAGELEVSDISITYSLSNCEECTENDECLSGYCRTDWQGGDKYCAQDSTSCTSNETGSCQQTSSGQYVCNTTFIAIQCVSGVWQTPDSCSVCSGYQQYDGCVVGTGCDSTPTACSNNLECLNTTDCRVNCSSYLDCRGNGADYYCVNNQLSCSARIDTGACDDTVVHPDTDNSRVCKSSSYCRESFASPNLNAWCTTDSNNCCKDSNCNNDPGSEEDGGAYGWQTCAMFSDGIWGQCTNDDNCSTLYGANRYCNQDQTCNTKLAWGSSCGTSVSYEDTEINNSCSNGECYTTEGVCNVKPSVPSIGNVGNFNGTNYTNITWGASSDADNASGDSVTYDVRVGNSSGVTEVVFTDTGISALVVQATGLIWKQIYYTDVRACDSYNYCSAYSSDDSFQRTNAVPYFVEALTSQNVSHNVNLNYDINCSDADIESGDTLTYYDNTSLFNINSSTGQITDNPTQAEAGTYNIEINCSDGTGQNYSNFTYIIHNSAPSVDPQLEIIWGALRTLPNDKDINCSYSYSDAESDAESDQMFVWYVNDSNVSTEQILGKNNFSLGDIVICGVNAYDSALWSGWTNSSSDVVGDLTPPDYINHSINGNSFLTTQRVVITVNARDNQTDLEYVRLTISGVEYNTTQTGGTNSAGNISEWKLNRTFGAGTYTLTSIEIRDGSDQTKTETVSTEFVVNQPQPSGGGGGGGGITYVVGAANKTECEIFFNPTDIKLSNNKKAEELEIFNQENFSFDYSLEYPSELLDVRAEETNIFPFQSQNLVVILKRELDANESIDTTITISSDRCIDYVIPVKLTEQQLLIDFDLFAGVRNNYNNERMNLFGFSITNLLFAIIVGVLSLVLLFLLKTTQVIKSEFATYPLLFVGSILIFGVSIFTLTL